MVRYIAIKINQSNINQQGYVFKKKQMLKEKSKLQKHMNGEIKFVKYLET